MTQVTLPSRDTTHHGRPTRNGVPFTLLAPKLDALKAKGFSMREISKALGFSGNYLYAQQATGQSNQRTLDRLDELVTHPDRIRHSDSQSNKRTLPLPIRVQPAGTLRIPSSTTLARSPMREERQGLDLNTGEVRGLLKLLRRQDAGLIKSLGLGEMEEALIDLLVGD